MPPLRPSLSIALPPSADFHFTDGQMPRTPEAQQAEQQSAVEPPPPPRPQTFKIKRKRVSSAPLHEPDVMLDTTAIIPTIEMSEVPAQISSPTIQPTSAHLLSPIPLSGTFPRAVTPPRTPAPKVYTTFSQLESPAEEWDLINKTKPSFERAGSVCSSFSDSSISSCGSSAFSLPTGGYDSPDSEAPDPFTDHDTTKHESLLQSPIFKTDAHPPKRVKTRRDAKWTPQMDEHLWMTFMAYLSDPTLTPFKMLPGSTPPMGVCDQVASKAKRTWRPRKNGPINLGSIDALFESAREERAGSPDTIRPSTLQSTQSKWPSGAATRRRLRKLCQRRPYISAHYQRMLRTRSPSPFETSSPNSQQSSSFNGYDMVKSLVTSTAPSMQPDSMLAQLASDDTPQQPAPSQRQPRPDGWFDRIPRSKAHQKSASLQSELKLSLDDLAANAPTIQLASPFDADAAASNRTHLLHSMGNTKSLGRTEFNGKSLDSPVVFKIGAPTDRRSRKRRFRSDEEKPRRPPLEDVFGPPMQESIVRNRGFSVGAVRATDSLTKLFTPPVTNVDQVMSEAPSEPSPFDDVPMGSRSAPRRLAEPVPRLGSPFVETPPPNRQHNTFPRSLLPSIVNQEPFHQRLMQLASEQPSNNN